MSIVSKKSKRVVCYVFRDLNIKFREDQSKTLDFIDEKNGGQGGRTLVLTQSLLQIDNRISNVPS